MTAAAAAGPLGRAAIEAALPQRPPFLFLDQVIALEPGRSATGVWRLDGGEDFFRGHFPGRPILPGALVLEHMAQTAAFLLARSRPADAAPGLVVFGLIRNARFLAPVIPPATIETTVEAVLLHAERGIVEAASRVGDETVASARLQFGTVA